MCSPLVCLTVKLSGTHLSLLAQESHGGSFLLDLGHCVVSTPPVQHLVAAVQKERVGVPVLGTDSVVSYLCSL